MPCVGERGIPFGRRPCESRDLYAVSPVVKHAVQRLSRNNQHLCYGSLLSQGRRGNKHAFTTPRRDASEVCIHLSPRGGRRESRVRAAPAVSCARCTKKCAHEHTGSAEAIRPSLRNGFTAYFVLFPAIGLVCHRRLAKPGQVRARLGRPASARLDAGVEASEPHDFTVHGRLAPKPSTGVVPIRRSPGEGVFGIVRQRAPSSLTGEPALRHFARPTLPRPPHPAPTFVTMANAPLKDRTREL
jgi:hypothetical protein